MLHLTIQVEEGKYAALIRLLKTLDYVKIVSENLPLPPKKAVPKKQRTFGFAKNQITYVAPDFDETPPGFEDYVPS